jgi:hypothetical protein
MQFYGYTNRKQIELMNGEICQFFDGNLLDGDQLNQKYLNAYNLQMETPCAETQLGTFPDLTNESGFGICQFDEIGFNHAKSRSMKYQNEIYDKWGVNIDLIQLIELRYNVFLSLLFCRLFYKSIPDQIPSSREDRALYWKKHYNTYKGKGTTLHYLQSCAEILGEEK